MVIKTDRLILRQWKEEDLELFAQLNADPRVMEYFPALLTRKESDERALCWQEKIEKSGWGFWAVSLPGVAEFIGCIGLLPVQFQAPFTPAVEIGWRLAFDYWGKGYATEGAKASLAYGFQTLLLNEIVAFTTTQNRRSRHVMEKIGMHRYPGDDFDHPNLPKDHPFLRHVLYRIQADEWRK